MTEIYVIFHNTYEDTNAFYLTFDEAYKHIESLVDETETKLEEWSIRKLTEGVKFEADFTSFFTKSNTLVFPLKSNRLAE